MTVDQGRVFVKAKLLAVSLIPSGVYSDLLCLIIVPRVQYLFIWDAYVLQNTHTAVTRN